MGLFVKQLSYHLNKRGILVFYWVLNSEKEFQTALDVSFVKKFVTLIKRKVNGIMTDRLHDLNDFLRGKGREGRKS